MVEMPNQSKELEVKFYITNFQKMENRFKSLGGLMLQPRKHEHNLIFDTPDGKLTQDHQILRLRQDIDCYLTFKGPGSSVNGVYSRKEIEIAISDFDKAKELLEALDFKVTMTYEKYRTKYNFDGVHVTIDEMPIGNFIEVEGPDGDKIKTISLKLGLAWETRILDSYDTLFHTLCNRLGVGITNMTFESFEDIIVTPELIGVIPADE